MEWEKLNAKAWEQGTPMINEDDISIKFGFRTKKNEESGEDEPVY